MFLVTKNVVFMRLVAFRKCLFIFINEEELKTKLGIWGITLKFMENRHIEGKFL